MGRIDYFFRETVIGLRRNGLVVFAAISTAFIALFLLGMALLIRREVDLVVSNTTGRVEVVVYLTDGIGPDQQERLNGILSDLPQVDTVAERRVNLVDLLPSAAEPDEILAAFTAWTTDGSLVATGSQTASMTHLFEADEQDRWLAVMRRRRGG